MKHCTIETRPVELSIPELAQLVQDKIELFKHRTRDAAPKASFQVSVNCVPSGDGGWFYALRISDLE